MPTAELHFGCFHLKPRERQLLADGSQVMLDDRAFDLLFALASQPGQLVSKADLTRLVWPNSVAENINLEVHISKLRKILARYPNGRNTIENVAGRGYSFVPVVRFEREAADSEIIGREDDIASVTELLRQRRLVTIVGPGGVGKSTVAAAVIDVIARESRRSTTVLDFSSISDPRLVASALASALNVPVVSQAPINLAIRELRGKQTTLLLESCEHVMHAVTELAEALLAADPGVSILATSQEPLKADGEWIYRLRPLTIPAATFKQSLEEAMAFSAVRLFLTRAKSASDDFTIAADNVQAVCNICIALDGLPLAIELAAAQVRFLGIRQLLVQLTDRFDILTEGRRMALPRHRTLRAALDWGYDALSDDEQEALRSLSVLRGHFDIEAAIALSKPPQKVHYNFYSVFGRLVDRSFVSVDSDSDPPTYRLPDSTRQYAFEKLTQSGDLQAASARHAIYLRSWLHNVSTQETGIDFKDWRARCKRIIDDLRAAIQWGFSAEGEPVLACELVTLSMPVWQQLSLLAEYQNLTLRALGTIESRNLDLPKQKLLLHLTIGFIDAVGGTVIHEMDCDGYTSLASALEYAQATGEVNHELDALYGPDGRANSPTCGHLKIPHLETRGA